jgi:hypothetical protein
MPNFRTHISDLLRSRLLDTLSLKPIILAETWEKSKDYLSLVSPPCCALDRGSLTIYGASGYSACGCNKSLESI